MLFFYESNGITKQLRPALNTGIQHHFLEEQQIKKGFWDESDYEEVYQDTVLDGTVGSRRTLSTSWCRRCSRRPR